MTTVNHTRAAACEFLGTAFLTAAVVGSGIAGERLSNGNLALALLANSVATGGALVALILAFSSVSGAHFNPAVTLVSAAQGHLRWQNVPSYVIAQIAGALMGTACANIMFGLPLFFASHHARSGGLQLFSEFVATFGLVAVIWGCARGQPSAAPYAVAAYITAGYWFTASTAFANPAITFARAWTDTFSGIRPADVGGFVAAQIVGATAFLGVSRWIDKPQRTIQ